MRIWSSQSISGRLMRLIVLASGVALLLAYVSYLAYDFYSLRRSLIESIDSQANLIGLDSETALLFDDQQTAEMTLTALRGAPSILEAEIFDANGNSFAHYVRPGSAPALASVPRLPSSSATASWIESGAVLVGRAIDSNGKRIGAVYILAETRDVMHEARQFGLISAAVLLVCLGIALLATLPVRGSVIQPLEELAEAARAVSREKDYSVRVRVPERPDEIALVAQSFNEMLDEIEQNRDVLERKVAERTQELSAANRELEAFAYTVAHDLRGPLQQVTNISYLLELQDAAPHQRPLLTEILTATARMSSLIEDLLNLSRATSAPLTHVPVDISEMARNFLDTLAQGSGRKVEAVIADDCTAFADKGLVTVVLENLLRNAWKYTSRKEVARIEVGCYHRGAETVFFVRDNGAGFDPAQAERLFEPFQRLHSQAEFPGTGIGLATVKRIVSRHGGRVWASGTVGEGAEFCFTLPNQPVTPENQDSRG